MVKLIEEASAEAYQRGFHEASVPYYPAPKGSTSRDALLTAIQRLEADIEILKGVVASAGEDP
jgi:hypothetical protein